MLATVAQVGAILGVDTFTAEEEDRIEELIALAQGAIRDNLGREPEGMAYTDVILTAPIRSSQVLLPHWPLASVEAIAEDDEDLTPPAAYTVDLGAGILNRWDAGLRVYWFAGVNGLTVSYTSATIAELAALCATIVARVFSAGKVAAAVPAFTAGFTQLTVGRWSGTIDKGATDSVGALSLTETELATVRSWRDRLA